MDKKRFFLMKTALALFMALCSVWGWGQTTESFETGLPTSYTASLQPATLGTGTWQIRDVIAGTTGVQTGTKSAQIRSATNAQIITPTLSGGVGVLSFYVTSSTASGSYQVNVSNDDGVTWAAAPGSPFTIGTTKTLRSININNSNVNKIQIYRTGGTIYIDDVTWLGYTPTCITSTFSFNSSSINKVTSDAPFTNTFTTNNSSARVYSSSNTNAAIVDASGLVTIVGAGNSTISVTQIADGTHCAVSDSYALTVTSTTPTINAEGTLSTFTYVAGIGPSTEQSFTVSGSNLTTGVTVTAPANFEVSTTSGSGFSNVIILAQTGGDVYARMVSGLPVDNYSGDIVLTSPGATDVNVAVDGSVALGVPTAAAATDIASDSFTANWNTVTGADGYELDVYKVVGSPMTDLIISEYVEGSGNNKAIEIFNGTGAPVDLSNYSLRKQSNGAGIYDSNLPLVGTLQNGATYVVANSSAGTSLLPLAQQTSNTATMTFNGNDAVALFKNGTQLDEVGVFNQTANWGNDITLRRKSSVGAPKATYVTAEWDSFPTDTFIGFGSHTANTVTQTLVFSQNVGNVTSYQVGNLTPETTYQYVVRAIASAITSSDSNEIEVTTTAVPAVTWNGLDWSNGTGPDATMLVVIAGDYSINDSFEAASLTVNTGITLTVGTSVKTGDVTNNGNIVVADNASFIQTADAEYEGAGNFTVNRSSASAASKYAFWSSPVVDQNMYAIFPGSTIPFVMTYNTTTDNYNTLVNPANAIAGLGYSIKTPTDAPATATFNGVPNNGAFTTDLSLAGEKYNLVGNPYPSNLDLTAFNTANASNIDPTYWFWDNTSNSVTNQTGSTGTNYGYATYNADAQTWTPAPNTSTIRLENNAKVGQAFIVSALTNTLAFNNNFRVAETGVDLNKSTAVNAEEGKFWLSLTSTYNSNVTQAITYQTGASDEYDRFDSRSIGIGSDAFYSFAGAEKVIIQSKAPFRTNDVVVLGNKHFDSGTFTITLVQKEGLFTTGQAIYLKDKLTGTETNLQNGAYTFTSAAGEFADRFEIAYTQRVLGTDTSAKNELSVYRQGEDFVINSPSKINSVEVYDASGRLIKSLKANGNKQTVTNLGKGVYILHIQTATENVSKKVIK